MSQSEDFLQASQPTLSPTTTRTTRHRQAQAVVKPSPSGYYRHDSADVRGTGHPQYSRMIKGPVPLHPKWGSPPGCMLECTSAMRLHGVASGSLNCWIYARPPPDTPRPAPPYRFTLFLLPRVLCALFRHIRGRTSPSRPHSQALSHSNQESRYPSHPSSISFALYTPLPLQSLPTAPCKLGPDAVAPGQSRGSDGQHACKERAHWCCAGTQARELVDVDQLLEDRRIDALAIHDGLDIDIELEPAAPDPPKPSPDSHSELVAAAKRSPRKCKPTAPFGMEPDAKRAWVQPDFKFLASISLVGSMPPRTTTSLSSAKCRPGMAALLDILGADPDLDPEPFSFLSLGEGAKQHNMGKVYSGLYECKGHIVPYLVIAKVQPTPKPPKPSTLTALNKVHCIVLFACLPIQLPRPSGQKLTLKIGPRPLLPLHRPLPAVPGTRARPPTWRELAPAAHIHFLWPAGKNGRGCGQEDGSTRGQGNGHGNGHTSGLTSTVPQKRKLGMSSGWGGNGGHGGSKAALPFSLSPVIFRLGLIFLVICVLDRAHEHADTRQHGADASTQRIWARGSRYGFVSILRLRTPGSSSAAGGEMGIIRKISLC
ncbi:hypothetical protein K438DRAFT_2154329 [Mycena galopus ATCC 62051]|nr:hypothetical protein K438DRAFT_2154329 [Mycena galopus ATCC 62051]